jgi:hypothetical protein
MPRIAIFVMMAVMSPMPALATSSGTVATPDQSQVSVTGAPATQAGAGAQYVRAACDVRRPSCRRWRALAGERLEKSDENE